MQSVKEMAMAEPTHHLPFYWKQRQNMQTDLLQARQWAKTQSDKRLPRNTNQMFATKRPQSIHPYGEH
jgi:hypothetical protein